MMNVRRCLHLYEKTLSSDNSHFFSHWSLGVLIVLPLSPSKAVVRWHGGLEIHKEDVFFSLSFLLFLQLGWLTRLIRTTPKNASLWNHLSSVSVPIPSSPLPHHQTKRSVFDSLHFISSLPPLVPAALHLSCSPPQPSLYKLPSASCLWLYVSCCFHWLHKVFWVVVCFMLSAVNRVVCEKQQQQQHSNKALNY